jgi:hypothetical protein
MNCWLLLLAPPLLAYASPLFDGYDFSLLYLLVPLAALLGQWYGVSGIISIALGGLVFVTSVRGSWGSLGGSPALYLIGLAVAAIAAAPRPLLDCLRLWPEEDRAAARLAFVAPLLLVLSVGISGPPSPRGIQLSFRFGFATLGYFLLFVMGARGVRTGALLLGLLAAGALTWPLGLNDLLPRQRHAFFVSMGVMDPATMLAALAAFSAGAATSAVLRGAPLAVFWRWPYAAVAALLVLWFGPDPIAAIPVKLGTVQSIYILQVTAALPLAAFMTGLLRGARGVIVASALVTALMLAWVVIAKVVDADTGHPFRFGRIALEAPFVAAAYAVLGAKVAEARTGSSEFRLLRVPAFALLVLGTGLAIWGDGGAARMVLAGVFVIASVAIFFAAVRLRRAMAGSAFEITAERWLGLATILALALSVVANLEAGLDSLNQFYVLILLPRAIYDPAALEQLRNDAEMLAMVAGLAVIYLLVLLSIIRSLVRMTPKIYADTRQILAFAREWWRGRMPRPG